MGLFSLLLGMFLSGIVEMTKRTIQAQNSETNAFQARAVYRLLDRQVRPASEVNGVATPIGSGSWYLEVRDYVVAAGEDPLCTQWRFDPTAKTISYRTFEDVAPRTPSSWHVVSGGLAPNDDGTAPVGMSPTDTTYSRQRVTLHLTIRNGTTRAARLDSVLVARNTSPDTTTNTLLSSNASSHPVCQ